MKRRSGIAVAILVLCAGACIPRFREPDVRLDAVRVGGLGFEGGTLYVHLVVANPNAYRLESATMRYKVEMNDPAGANRWLELATGSIDRTLRVEAMDSAVVEVPVDFTYIGLGSALRSVMLTGELHYRVSGDMRVTQPLRRAVPFRQVGTVSFATGSRLSQGVESPNGVH